MKRQRRTYPNASNRLLANPQPWLTLAILKLGIIGA